MLVNVSQMVVKISKIMIILQKVFAKVHSIVSEGGADAKTLPMLLRKSTSLRNDVINKLTQVKSDLIQAAGSRLSASARQIDLTDD